MALPASLAAPLYCAMFPFLFQEPYSKKNVNVKRKDELNCKLMTIYFRMWENTKPSTRITTSKMAATKCILGRRCHDAFRCLGFLTDFISLKKESPTGRHMIIFGVKMLSCKHLLETARIDMLYISSACACVRNVKRKDD